VTVKATLPGTDCGRLITSDARCTREIKDRIAMAKAAFNRKKTFFINKLDLN
jgi:hypothetical protein